MRGRTPCFSSEIGSFSTPASAEKFLNFVKIIVHLVIYHSQVLKFDGIPLQQKKFLRLEKIQVRKSQAIIIVRLEVFNIVLQIIGEIAKDPVVCSFLKFLQLFKGAMDIGLYRGESLYSQDGIKTAVLLLIIVAV